MRRNERSKVREGGRKGSVAKTILFSYLTVLLLPLILTVIITVITVTKLQAQSAQYITVTATELSRLIGAQLKEIQTSNARILLTEEARQVAAVNAGEFAMTDIGRLRSLQKQLPRDTVTSEYIQAIYVCFPRSGTILTAGGVYYNNNANYMLRDYLGMSLASWKTYLGSVVSEHISMVTGDLDNRRHILIAKRLSSKGGLSDVIVVSEFRGEKAILLMDEFSEAGGLIHSLVGQDGTVLPSSYLPAEHIRYEEQQFPIGDGSVKSGIVLRTQTPRNWFLRRTMPLFCGLGIFLLFFAVAGGLLIHYFTKKQYSPIEQLNASLLASLNRNNTETERRTNEYEQMSEAVAELLQTNASSRAENEQLRENIRSQLLRGILFGNIRKENIILRHAENNGIRFAGHRFLVVLYAVEDLPKDERTHELMQNEDAVFRLDEIIRTAISQLPDNGCTRYTVELEEQVACMISLPDEQTEEQIWRDLQANVQHVREFFRDSFGVILSAAVSGLHSGVVSITTCFRECREAADYMELIGTTISVCRYDQIPSASEHAISFPEVLEKEKKLCRNLSTGDYVSAEASWQDVQEALFLKKCAPTEARARLLGAVTLMSSSLSDLPPELEESVHRAFSVDKLQQLDPDSMLKQIGQAISSLSAYAAKVRDVPENSSDLQYIQYVNEHITDPNLSISLIADHFNMSTSYFSKRFKKATGESLLDHIHRERLTMAKQIMAEHPEATLKEICDQVGYASPLTLNRAFRKYEGITPSDYRAQL